MKEAQAHVKRIEVLEEENRDLKQRLESMRLDCTEMEKIHEKTIAEQTGREKHQADKLEAAEDENNQLKQKIKKLQKQHKSDLSKESDRFKEMNTVWAEKLAALEEKQGEQKEETETQKVSGRNEYFKTHPLCLGIGSLYKGETLATKEELVVHLEKRKYICGPGTEEGERVKKKVKDTESEYVFAKGEYVKAQSSLELKKNAYDEATKFAEDSQTYLEAIDQCVKTVIDGPSPIFKIQVDKAEQD